MNVVLEYPLEAATGVPPVPATPKNLSKMGRGTQPAQPGAKLVPPRAARFFWALRNSCRKPFSKMLISLMSCARHVLGARLPLYRISRAVSLNAGRSSGTPPGPSTPTRFEVCGLVLLNDERFAVAINPGLVVPTPKRLVK